MTSAVSVPLEVLTPVSSAIWYGDRNDELS
jgi:hypothetical protein